MKDLILNYKQFIIERYVGEEVISTTSALPPNFIKPNNVFSYEAANNMINMLTSKYKFHPETQNPQLSPNDMVKFYHGSSGNLINAKQEIATKMNADINQFGIENPKKEFYIRGIDSSTNELTDTDVSDVVGILIATNQTEENPHNAPLGAQTVSEEDQQYKELIHNRYGIAEELTDGQKKLPKGLQDSILKKQGKESIEKTEESEDDDLIKSDDTNTEKE